MKENPLQFEHSIECKTDKSFLWSFWTDVSNWERIEGEAVEWIKLDGSFEVGTNGTTKPLNQSLQKWKIIQVELGNAATIEIILDGAVLHNFMLFETISSNNTLITQRFSLKGIKAPDYAQGLQMLKINVPQGLAKLVKAVEEAFKKANSND